MLHLESPPLRPGEQQPYNGAPFLGVAAAGPFSSSSSAHLLPLCRDNQECFPFGGILIISAFLLVGAQLFKQLGFVSISPLHRDPGPSPLPVNKCLQTMCTCLTPLPFGYILQMPLGKKHNLICPLAQNQNYNYKQEQ